MACPRAREVVGGVGVTLLACFEEVGFDTSFWVIWGEDFVDAMTIVADSFIGGSVGVVMVKEGNGSAVEISDVGVEDFGGDIVFGHEFVIGVTIGAKLGGADAEEVGGGVANSMNTVTVGAGRDILVIFGDEGIAVNTGGVFIVNFTMALLAGLDGAEMGRNFGIMRAVTIGADGGLGIARFDSEGVDTILGFFGVCLVTFGTAFILSDGVVAGGGGGNWFVGIS